MNDTVTIHISPSFSALCAVKLHFWRRRSLPRYLLASLLFAIGFGLLSQPPEVGRVLAYFFVAFTGVIAFSLLVIAVSASVLASRFRAQVLRLEFSESGITGSDGGGRTLQFAWSVLDVGRETERAIILPDHGILRGLLRTRVLGRRSALILEKSELTQRGVAEDLCKLLRAQGKL